MKQTFVADRDGDVARADARRKKLQGVFEVSCPHELLFTQVSKEVLTKVMMGLVVDFRPPLFSVVWSDGREELLVKKELDFFRRVHTKQEFDAKRRVENKIRRNAPPERAKQALGGKFALTMKDMVEPVATEVQLDPRRDRSALEWRLLEIAAEKRAEAANGPSMASLIKAATGVGGEEEEEEEDTGAVILIRNCPHLQAGRGPPDGLWYAAGGNVSSLAMVSCGLKGRPPTGVLGLVNLRVLDLRLNSIKCVDPQPLPEDAPTWATGKLKELVELNLSNNLLGQDHMGTYGGSVGRLSDTCLGWCKNLTSLDLSNNSNLAVLPDSLSSLAKLAILKVGHCCVEKVATHVWNLTNLKRLELQHNALKSLDDLDGFGLVVAAKVAKLKGLTYLDLAANQLTVLPEDVWELTALSHLNVSGNPGLATPPDIPEPGEMEEEDGPWTLDAEPVAPDHLGMPPDYAPCPIVELRLKGCGLSHLPAVLGASAFVAARDYAAFEGIRRQEILNESASDSSSEEETAEEAAFRKKKGKGRRAPSGGDSVASLDDRSAGGASVASALTLQTLATADSASFAQSAASAHSVASASTASTSSASTLAAANALPAVPVTVPEEPGSPSSPAAPGAARRARRAAKRAAKAERRSRVAPHSGTEHMTMLDLSHNRLTHFPGAALFSDGLPHGASSLPLGLVSKHLFGLTALDLSNNLLEAIDPEVFAKPRCPLGLTSIDLR